jgi:hypothetical protein
MSWDILANRCAGEAAFYSATALKELSTEIYPFIGSAVLDLVPPGNGFEVTNRNHPYSVVEWHPSGEVSIFRFPKPYGGTTCPIASSAWVGSRAQLVFTPESTSSQALHEFGPVSFSISMLSAALRYGICMPGSPGSLSAVRALPCD